MGQRLIFGVSKSGANLTQEWISSCLTPSPPFSLLKSFSSSPHTIQINRKRDSDTLDKEARLLLDPSQVENMIVGCLY